MSAPSQHVEGSLPALVGTGLVWDELTRHLERFAQAWDEAESEPDLRAYLPDAPPALRRLTLVELVKFDLERRWPDAALRKPLERYREDFPELEVAGELPTDLVYEELQIRKRNGEAVDIESSAERFPEHLGLLQALRDSGTTASSSQVRHRHVAEMASGTTLDEFEILATLGRGAFGHVYLALQRSVGRILALKVTRDEGFETQTLAQLDHPNIVRVYDQRRLDDRHLHLMYMQWVPGGSMRAVVERVVRTPIEQRTGAIVLDSVDDHRSPFADVPPGDPRAREFLAGADWPTAVAWLGARLASALEHAHARGVLHRDIKPANILLAADGSPHLADFNISSCGSLPASMADAYFGGSLAYMAPEHLAAFLGHVPNGSENVDTRSDLFSLGVVLWELLRGDRPFRDSHLVDFSPSALEELAQRRTAGVSESDWRDLAADCPRGLVVTLKRCLEPNRETRVGTARLLRRMLDLCRWPESFDLLFPVATPAWEWVGRHPLPLVLLGGLLPNAVAAVLNIAYNRYESLQGFADPRVLEIFRWQIATINPLAFTIGTVIVVAFLGPLLRAVRALARREALDEPQRREALRRSLVAGDVTARVSGVEWLVSSLILPTWLHLGADLPQFGLTQYVQWFFAQSICGLIAVTFAFFAITLACLRCLTPRVIDPLNDDPQLAGGLDRLESLTTLYSRLSFAVVPLALVAMAVVQPVSPWTFKILGVVGLVSWALSVGMAARILRLIAAIRVVSNLETFARGQRTGG
jgi:eukaryotic-like serine/threonine-protein kinase